MSIFLKIFFLKLFHRISAFFTLILIVFFDPFQSTNAELPGALFKDFWFYATIFGLSDSSLGWPSELQNQIANIARFSPVLTFDDNQPVKQSLANHSALKDSNVTSKELEELRTGLLTTIGPKGMVEILSCP